MTKRQFDIITDFVEQTVILIATFLSMFSGIFLAFYYKSIYNTLAGREACVVGILGLLAVASWIVFLTNLFEGGYTILGVWWDSFKKLIWELVGKNDE